MRVGEIGPQFRREQVLDRIDGDLVHEEFDVFQLVDDHVEGAEGYEFSVIEFELSVLDPAELFVDDEVGALLVGLAESCFQLGLEIHVLFQDEFGFATAREVATEPFDQHEVVVLFGLYFFELDFPFASEVHYFLVVGDVGHFVFIIDE